MNVMEQFLQNKKLGAVEWARKALGEPFIVFDTETTGFKSDDEILQIAVIDSDGNELMNTRVRPTRKQQWPKAQEIHGTSPEDVADAPTIDELLPQIADLFSDSRIVAYNLAYDKRLMAQSLAIAGIKDEWEEIRKSSAWGCVMLAYAEMNGDWSNYHQSFKWVKLVDACEKNDVKVKDAHDALGDVRMTLALVERMAQVEVKE